MMNALRSAGAEDAVAISDVLRRSITECCSADHRGDPVLIAAWLQNKTPQNIATWIASESSVAVVASTHDRLIGFALANGGTLSLCYVLPEILRQGIGRKMLLEIENRSAALGITLLQTESTRTALPFYLRNGFVSSGPPQQWAGMEGQPMVKALVANPPIAPMPFSAWQFEG